MENARDRIARVFRFLEALHQHRSPPARLVREQPWFLWLHRLPGHPAIRIGTYEDYVEGAGADGDTPAARPVAPKPEANAAEGADFVLKVRRPVLTGPPTVPEVLDDWLDEGWDDPFQEAEFIGSITWEEDAGPAEEAEDEEEEQFEDVPERVKAFGRWSRERAEWAAEEIPARKAYWVYEQLYELHGILERESERVELVLGDGILKWHGDDALPEGRGQAGGEGGDVEHPILLDRVQLAFDPGVPEFTVTEVGTETELYAALLRSIPGIEGPTISKFQEELEKGFYHPLGGDATTDFLRRVIARLSRHGRLAGEGLPSAAGRREDDGIQLGRTPVLFLRKREQGFGEAIHSIGEDVQGREDLPVSLLGIVGARTPESALGSEGGREGEEADAAPGAGPEPRDILLSKPANPEQIRIARSLKKRGAVLVQGPPGTGKSHTIANLIGHLLAEGRSVLVIAHTTKALRVLRHHVVEPLRPLCVSVLDRDTESRGQLEAAVQAIAEKMSTSSPGRLDDSARTLEKERTLVLDGLDARRDDLCRAIGSEYASIVVDGTELSPTEAARTVAGNEERDGWIPGTVEGAASSGPLSDPTFRAASPPLSAAEVAELYATNEKLSPADELDLGGELPDAGDLPSPRRFGEMLARKGTLDGEDKGEGEDYWTDPTEAGPSEGVTGLEELEELLAAALADLSAGAEWRLSIVEAGYKGDVHREPWSKLLDQLREYCRESADGKNMFLEHGPRLKATDLPLEDLLATVEEMVAHLEAGGGLGWFTRLRHPSWRYLIGHARVSDGWPRKLEHFKAVMSLIRGEALLEKLKGRWDRQVAALGGPSSDDFVRPEEAFRLFADQIGDLLSWREKKLEPLRDGLKRQGFDWEEYSEDQRRGHTSLIAGSHFADLMRLRDTLLSPLARILSSRLAALRRREIDAELERLRTCFAGKEAQHPAAVTKELAAAVGVPDNDRYEAAYRRLRELRTLRKVLDRRNGLLAKLEGSAPGWADGVRRRKGVHGRAEAPGDVGRAWIWKQLVRELDVRHEVSIEEIQRDVEELGERLRRTTVELIDARAWAHQIRRTKEHPRQKQALIGWLDTIKRIGAGTGKRVPLLNRRLREQMAECREAVPVWVMPLSRLPDNFDFRRTRFDVVIVDEASQSDVMALLALWIARTVVIVGDHEQVSPTAVGQNVDAVQKLIDEHLEGIPNSHLYDGRMSVYDLARQSFGDTICLLEHFRCAPDIIGFSNSLSYDGRIKPLRDTQQITLAPSVIAHRVEGGAAKDKVNEKEARAVAALVVAATEQPEYEGKTVGVISMVGEEQALLMERLILEHLEPREIESRRIISGNPAQFQGDERDVMFLSMVDSSPDGKPLNRRTEDMYKQRFNVAASRAKDQMWVVHSLDVASDLKDGDLRRRLIEYAANPAGGRPQTEPDASGQAGEEAKAGSRLERDVAGRLAAAGYRARSRLDVGYYRIDLVVHDLKGRRLAVECDGDRFRPVERIPEEMARQAALERLGWKFVHVRGSLFYRDPDAAMAPVLDRLKLLGVEPDLGSEEAEAGGQGEKQELKDRVVRRALELQDEWKPGKTPAAGK